MSEASGIEKWVTILGIGEFRGIAGLHQSHAFDDRFRREVLGACHHVLERIERVQSVLLLHDDRPVVELLVHEVLTPPSFSPLARSRNSASVPVFGQQGAMAVDDPVVSAPQRLLVELGSGDRDDEVDLVLAQVGEERVEFTSTASVTRLRTSRDGRDRMAPARGTEPVVLDLRQHLLEQCFLGFHWK